MTVSRPAGTLKILFKYLGSYFTDDSEINRRRPKFRKSVPLPSENKTHRLWRLRETAPTEKQVTDTTSGWKLPLMEVPAVATACWSSRERSRPYRKAGQLSTGRLSLAGLSLSTLRAHVFPLLLAPVKGCEEEE